MKSLILGIAVLFSLAMPTVSAQVPPGHIYGQCSNLFGPVYDTSTRAYTASGTCQNGNPVNCGTDPIDGTPDYYCTANGDKEQDPNPSVAADEACGCLDT